MYDGRDGNVYENTGNGWQKYDNRNWNAAATPYNSAARPRTQNSQKNSRLKPAHLSVLKILSNGRQVSQVTPSTAQAQPRQSYRPTNNTATQNTTAQPCAQSAQSYQQSRPTAANGQATPQPRPQSYQQQRPQTFNQQAGNDPLSSVQQEAQNRLRGA